MKVLKPFSPVDAALDFDNEGTLLRQLAGCGGVINIIESGTSSVDATIGAATMPVPLQFHILTRASGSVNELILDPISRQKMSWIELLGFWRDVILAVKQMHGSGVAHRDLKCDNCLLLLSRRLSTVKLTDLGRGKNFTLDPTRPPEHYVQGRGQLLHSPPEFLLFQGGASASDFIAADYYGIGSILAELATGQSMSTLAISDIGAVIQQAQVDYLAGRRTDLNSYRSNYRNAISLVVEQIPGGIRDDARTLLTHLCQPVPGDRLASPPYRRDRLSRDKLDWVLRRTDIMIRRLEIHARDERRAAEKQRRSAS